MCYIVDCRCKFTIGDGATRKKMIFSEQRWSGSGRMCQQISDWALLQYGEFSNFAYCLDTIFEAEFGLSCTNKASSHGFGFLFFLLYSWRFNCSFWPWSVLTSSFKRNAPQPSRNFPSDHVRPTLFWPGGCLYICIWINNWHALKWLPVYLYLASENMASRKCFFYHWNGHFRICTFWTNIQLDMRWPLLYLYVLGSIIGIVVLV